MDILNLAIEIHNKNKKSEWRGLDKGDGRYRIVKIKRSFKNSNNFTRGRILKTLSKNKLIKIVWNIGIPIPIEHRISNLNMDDYIMYWSKLNKKDIVNAIWKYLKVTNNIIQN